MVPCAVFVFDSSGICDFCRMVSIADTFVSMWSAFKEGEGEDI